MNSEETRLNVVKALDEIRPFLENDGGNINLIAIENNEIVKVGIPSNFKVEELLEYQKSTVSALGASVKFNKENAIAFATMQQRLGLSTEEATKLTFLASATGKSVTQQNEAIVAQVQAMNVNNKTGIKYQQVMKDISEAGSATALTIGKFPGGMAKAAFNPLA